MSCCICGDSDVVGVVDGLPGAAVCQSCDDRMKPMSDGQRADMVSIAAQLRFVPHYDTPEAVFDALREWRPGGHGENCPCPVCKLALPIYYAGLAKGEQNAAGMERDRRQDDLT